MAERPYSLHSLSSEEKKRLAYIEGRDDLFETKIFTIQDNPDSEHLGGKKKNVLVISRDPGSANALVPVMELAHRDDTITMTAMTDGRAEEILQRTFPTKDITPLNTVLDAGRMFDTPNALLMGSSVSERGIETFTAANYPDVPAILIEDYYTSSLGLLQRLKERKLPYPRKICVIDREAKKLVTNEFPELEGRIEVTGQPAFDRFATEDTERLKTEVRNELGMAPDEKLITFMSISTGSKMEFVEKIATELKKIKATFRFAFGIHPRDNTPRETYEEIFKKAGIAYIDVDRVGIDKIGVASDVMMMIISTEGLHAIYRRKPTIHITDPRFVVPLKGLSPPPPVTLGASVGLDDLSDLAVTLEQLIDPESPENKELRTHMEENYPVDGKNAQRVANLLKAEME